MNATMRVLCGGTAIVSLLALQAAPAWAADPGAICAATKQKAAAKKLGDKVKCYGKAIKKGIVVDPECLTKAETKFATAFAKAEGKGGCATTGDAATVEGLIDDMLGQLLLALPLTTTTTTLPGCIDQDSDGYGTNCPLGDDCDDNNASINPGAEEFCDLCDHNCDGEQVPVTEECGLYVYPGCLDPDVVCPTNDSTACEAYQADAVCFGCLGWHTLDWCQCNMCIDDPSGTWKTICAVCINDVGCGPVCCPS